MDNVKEFRKVVLINRKDGSHITVGPQLVIRDDTGLAVVLSTRAERAN